MPSRLSSCRGGLGAEIKTIYDGEKSAGEHTLVWDGTGMDGKSMSSAVYLCQLQVIGDGQVLRDVKKAVLLI